MNRPGRNEDGLPRPRMEFLKQTFRSPLLKRSPESPLLNARLQCEQGLRITLGADEVPHLTLAQVSRIVHAGVIVIRMDLDREPVAREDVFGKERKPAVPPVPAMQFRPVLSRCLSQGEPG